MDFALSTQKLAVIDALSSGATITDAAEQIGIHRNTISNWRRNSPDFQEAFAHAQYDRALFFREKVEALADLAIQTIHALLTDPKTPPSVRLRAALAILTTASTPPEPKKEVADDFEKIVHKRTTPQTVTEDQLGTMPPKPPSVHNPAQPEPQPPAPPVHNPAQPTSEIGVNRRSSAANPPSAQAPHPPSPSKKPGRNEACPCGSGQKYKRCCLNKPLVAKAA